MVDIGKTKVNYLERKKTISSATEHSTGRKVPVLDSKVMEGIHLRKQDKSLYGRGHRERFERPEGPTLTSDRPPGHCMTRALRLGMSPPFLSRSQKDFDHARERLRDGGCPCFVIVLEVAHITLVP